MKFHFNDVALRHTAQSRLPDREGRLLYRSSSKGDYKERWFRLQGNLLFYFRTNGFGTIADQEPLGVFVLTRFSTEMESLFADQPFVFTIAFEGEEHKKHYFSGQSMQHCQDWMDAFQRNSYEAVRMKFESLRRDIKQLTGRDPIKEKMSVAIKQKARSNAGMSSASSQELGRAKFYVEDGTNNQLLLNFPSVGKAISALQPEFPRQKQTEQQPLGSVSSSKSAQMLPQETSEKLLMSLESPEKCVSKPKFDQTSLLQQSSIPMVLPSPLRQPFLTNVLQPGMAQMNLARPGSLQMPLLQPKSSQIDTMLQTSNSMTSLQAGFKPLTTVWENFALQQLSGYTNKNQSSVELNSALPNYWPKQSQQCTEKPPMMPGSSSFHEWEKFED